MDIEFFIEGTLLRFSFFVLVVGALFRLGLFVKSILIESRNKESPDLFFLVSMLRSLLPLHRVVKKKPVYFSLIFLFHSCLIVVPLLFSGHIALWSDSRFGWEWTAIPDVLADWMTLTLILLTAFFIARRAMVKEIREQQTFMGYLLIVLTTLPFLSGYFLAHGTLNRVGFISANLSRIHVLSSEIMIIGVVFLFLVPVFQKQRCTGCAACEEHCPSGVIRVNDQHGIRTLFYDFRPCIKCATCVDICPEDAVALRHEMGFRKLFQNTALKKLIEIPMHTCEGCGIRYATEPQFHMIINLIEMDYVHFCPRCRNEKLREKLPKYS